MNHHQKFQVKREFYEDMVYCVEVPNHIIFVRRKGKTAWCGNCALAVYKEFTFEFEPMVVQFKDSILEKLQKTRPENNSSIQVW
jgi:hypothetical protein